MNKTDTSAAQKLRLGTRGSLLALAQSRMVAKELERMHKGLKVDVVIIETPGDRDLKTPLNKVIQPGFFSADLDHALLEGKIDFCVHSYKDIDLQRPAGIITAAIPQRDDPRDVILFRSDVEDLLQQGRPLRIGTSSVRRQINIADFLSKALPQLGQSPTLKFLPLRGAVDKRAAQILESAGENRLDGVVLALAGLNRLWQDNEGQNALQPALNNARWMVLPLDACPTAAGQGALRLECRAHDSDTLRLLAALHCEPEAERVALEVELLKKQPEDAVAGLGVSVVPAEEFNFVAHMRGGYSTDNPARLQKTLSGRNRQPAINALPWQSNGWLKYTKTEALTFTLPSEGALFVAHWRALQGVQPEKRLHIWTSGTMSWFKLAAQGVWVEGCAENLGFTFIKPLLTNRLLRLPPLNEWSAITHADAVNSWEDTGVGNVIASYRSVMPEKNRVLLRDNLEGHTHFYWSSAQQYKIMQAALPASAHHSCGAGKTLRELRAIGLKNVEPFISRREWQQWLA